MADRLHSAGIHFRFAAFYFLIIRSERNASETMEQIGHQPLALLLG